MSKYIYRKAFKSAWFLTWKNTNLWILGLLSILFAGSIGLSNFLSRIFLVMGSNKQSFNIFDLDFSSLGINKVQTILWLIWLIGIIIVIAIGVVYISVVAKTALLTAVAKYYKKKDEPNLVKIWNHGIKHFWQIFTIEITKKVLMALVIAIFTIIWIKIPFEKNFFNTILNIIILVASILSGWIITVLAIFTAGYAVIDKKPLITSVQKSWQLFHSHMLVSLEVGGLLIAIDILIILIFSAILSLTFIPALFIWILAGILGNTVLAMFSIVFGFILAIIFITLFGAIYNTFYTSVWMYLFMKMHHDGVPSRAIHHVSKFFKK